MIDSLIDMRASCREQKDWKTSDRIRDFLDSQGIIIFDTEWGQEVHNCIKGTTRSQVMERIAIDKRAEANFDAWLVSNTK